MRFNKMESKFSKSSLSAPLYFSAFSLLFFTCLFFLASVVLIPISIAKHHIYSHSLCMVNMDVFVCMFYYVQCIYMANLFLFLIVFFYIASHISIFIIIFRLGCCYFRVSYFYMVRFVACTNFSWHCMCLCMR